MHGHCTKSPCNFFILVKSIHYVLAIYNCIIIIINTTLYNHKHVLNDLHTNIRTRKIKNMNKIILSLLALLSMLLIALSISTANLDVVLKVLLISLGLSVLACSCKILNMES